MGICVDIARPTGEGTDRTRALAPSVSCTAGQRRGIDDFTACGPTAARGGGY